MNIVLFRVVSHYLNDVQKMARYLFNIVIIMKWLSLMFVMHCHSSVGVITRCLFIISLLCVRYFHKLTDSSKHKLGSHLGVKEKAADSDGSEVDDDDFDSYLHKYEKSLYADLKEDLFGADFARYFMSR